MSGPWTELLVAVHYALFTVHCSSDSAVSKVFKKANCEEFGIADQEFGKSRRLKEQVCATLNPESWLLNPADLKVGATCVQQIYGQAKRAIRTSQLSALLHLHTWPIYVVVFDGPSKNSHSA